MSIDYENHTKNIEPTDYVVIYIYIYIYIYIWGERESVCVYFYLHWRFNTFTPTMILPAARESCMKLILIVLPTFIYWPV